MLLHGFLGDARDTHALATALPSHIEALSLTLPGHAAGSGVMWQAPPASLEDAGAALLRTLDKLQLERVSVAAYSLGGRVLLAAWQQAPDRFERLALLGAALAPHGGAARRARDEAWAERMRNLSWDEVLAAWYAQPLFDRLREHDDFEDMLARRRDADPRAMAHVVCRWSPADQPNFGRELARRPTPLLLLAGAEDEAYVRRYEEAANALPHARLALIPESGHALLTEAPSAVAGHLTRFLAG